MTEPARVERFLNLLRETHPSFERIFTEGGCYHLFLILRSIWPQAELWYAHDPGHVYARIDGVFFDIKGGRRAVPEGAMPVTVRDLRRPDRWRKQMLWQENARLVA
jgi:hypothetical protein